MTRSKLHVCRVGIVGLGLVAMLAGLALGSTGCDECDCSDGVPISPIEPGTYEIVANPDRPELVGGVVELTTDELSISFVDDIGVEWAIEYAVTNKLGG